MSIGAGDAHGTPREGKRPVPSWLHALVDDAAVFPPGNAPLDQAITAHEGHRNRWYADLVGPLLCPDRRLLELQQLAADTAAAVDLGIVVTGGAGAIEGAVTWAMRGQSTSLRTVEIALRDEPDPARNARRVCMALSDSLPADVTASVEMPRLADDMPPTGWLGALDEIAASGHRVKYRTGGEDPAAYPSEHELATVISAALDRELELKCTAGLHHAVRHTGRGTGFEEHGFLNVLLATRACLDGASPDELREVLAQRDRDTVAAWLRDAGATALTSARRWFVSFGSCSIAEPLDDLVELGLERLDERR